MAIDQIMGPGSSGASVQIIKPNAPAAGTEFAYTFTQQLRLIAIFMRFTTSATVGNRLYSLNMYDNVNALIWGDQPITQAASLANYFSFYNGAGGNGTGNSPFQQSIPSFIMPIGAQIKTATGGLLAGDQYDLISIVGIPA